MHSDEHLTERILSSLAGLSAEEQADAVLALIGTAVKTMTIFRLVEIRQEIVRDLDNALPLVSAALDIIDGQIALREIAGEEDWR